MIMDKIMIFVVIVWLSKTCLYMKWEKTEIVYNDVTVGF